MGVRIRDTEAASGSWHTLWLVVGSDRSIYTQVCRDTGYTSTARRFFVMQSFHQGQILRHLPVKLWGKLQVGPFRDLRPHWVCQRQTDFLSK